MVSLFAGCRACFALAFLAPGVFAAFAPESTGPGPPVRSELQEGHPAASLASYGLETWVQ